MKCYNCNALQATPLLTCPAAAQCGTPYRPTDGKWQRAEPVDAYVNKIFSLHQAEGSSIFFPLNTADDPGNFTQVLDLTPCSDGCCRANAPAADAVFEIQKSYVQLDCLSVAETAAPRALSEVITPEMVNVNGNPVNAVTVNNGQYTADLSNLIGALTNPACMAQGLPSQAYLLLQNIPDLVMRVRFGFEGVMRSAGTIYRFKLYLANNEAIPLTDAVTSFAVASLNVPCVENGRMPLLNFRFGGQTQLLNPVLTAAEDPDTGEVTVQLATTLAITPQTEVEVTRETRMLVTGALPAADTTCGMDGFSLFAGTACCTTAQTSATAANTVVRCPCRGGQT